MANNTQNTDELKNLISEINTLKEKVKASDTKVESLSILLNDRQKELQLIESKYELISKNIAGVIWAYNIDDHRFIYVSASVYNMFGISPEEADKDFFISTMLPEDSKKLLSLFQSRAKGIKEGSTKSYRDLVKHILKDGTEIWVEVSTKFMLTADGIHKIIGVSRNVTKQKLFEQELNLKNKQLLEHERKLLESEERYKGIIERTDSCVAIYKPNKNCTNFIILELNKAALKLENVKNEEVVGKFVTHVFPGIIDFGLLDVFVRVCKTGRSENFPISYYRDNRIQGYRENFVFKLSTGEIIAVYKDLTEQKRDEEAILKLSTAINQSPSVIVITDLDGNIEYANPKFTELTGYSIEEALGQHTRLLKSGEMPDEIYTELWETIVSGNVWHGEFHNKKKDGELFWETASVAPIFNNDGKIINFLKVAEDITEFKEKEDELQASNTKFEKLFNGLSDAVFVTALGTNDRGKILEVNDAAVLQTGYSKEELLTMNILDNIVVADTCEYSIDDWELDLNNGKTIAAVEKKKRKDGTYFWTELSITKFNYNGIEASVSINHDITERKKAETIQKVLFNISNSVNTTKNLETLIATIRSELSILIDTTNFYVALYDAEEDVFTFPYYADKKDKFTSAKAAKTLSKYVIETKKSLFADTKIKKDLEDKGILVHQGSYSKIWLGVPLKIEGEIKGVLSVQSYDDEKAYSKDDIKMMEFVSDHIGISIERKQAEEKLKKALKNERVAARVKSAFLATISHELRTPLNAIIGFSSLINNEMPVDNIIDYVSTIHQSSKHLLNIMDEIFDVTLIETGQSKVHKQKVELYGLMNEISTLAFVEQGAMGKSNLGLKASVPNGSGTLSIYSDAFKVKQIFINLIKNALKFTEEGIIVFGFEIEDDEHFPQIKFFVKDTGIGIKKEKQGEIFDIFSKVDDKYTSTYGGLGVGLSISKKITELLDGDIWFDSEEGKGSTFYFTIPLIQDEKIIIPTVESTEKSCLKGCTVLVVEDDLPSFEYLQIVLKDKGAKVIFADNGDKSIIQCKLNANIDVVLMDINLPGIDGYTATKEIKKLRPGLPIIAQTALAVHGDRDKALAAGCDDYISKPINADKLMSVICKNLK